MKTRSTPVLCSSSIILVLIAIIITGCSPTDNLVNDLSDSYRLLNVSASAPTKLALISFPGSMPVAADVLLAYSGISAGSEITRIAQFQTNYYVFVPGDYKIIIISLDSLKSTGIIDFSAKQWRPRDICFANGTDAYVIHENTDSISLVDLSVNREARTLSTGKKAVAITITGNRIFTANQDDNSVSVIASNDHVNPLISTIYVSAKPTFIQATPDGSKVLVVSLGEGKMDSTQSKTDAMAQLIDATTLTVTKEKPVGTVAYKASDQTPQGMAISSKNWAFIATNHALFRYDVAGGERLLFNEKGNFYSAYNNFWKDEIMLLENINGKTRVLSSNPSSGAHSSSYDLGELLSYGLPIK